MRGYGRGPVTTVTMTQKCACIFTWFRTVLAFSLGSTLHSTAYRVVANGDSANKIGTYQLAIAANYHNVPFYIAAPFTTLDCETASGADIEIEERAGIGIADTDTSY